jgi:hypothetical protein
VRGSGGRHYDLAPLHSAPAAYDHAGAARGEFHFGKAAPVGNNGEAVDDLNQGGVIGRQWQVRRKCCAAAALAATGSRRSVLRWCSYRWERALNQTRRIARRKSLNRRR